MKSFLDKIIKEICEEEKINYHHISDNFITVLEKNNKYRYINGSRIGLNSQTAGMIADDKFAMYEILKFHKINVIEHVLIWNRNNSYLDIEEKIMFLKKYFHDHNNHIVLKPNMGYGGKMVFNITQEDEIKNIFLKLINYTNTIVLNPFYEIKNEHRLIILDGVCRLAFTKKLPKNGWQFNLSMGASSSKIKDNKLKKRLISLGLKAYKLTGARFLSIDIIEDLNNNLYVLEMNSGVSMEKYVTKHPKDYLIVKEIYKDAIKKLFNEC